MAVLEYLSQNISDFTTRKGDFLLPVGVSNRHIHLSERELEKLFGAGYELTVFKHLTQPGEFAAKEVVTIVGPKGVIEGVRVLGPVRKKTQVEISMTDSFRLGIKPPVRQSGHLEGTPGIAVVGPEGLVALPEGVILAARHIHLPVEIAEHLSLKDKDELKVHVGGPRAQVFENVLIRVNPKYALEMHVDTDEANAALIKTGDMVKLIH